MTDGCAPPPPPRVAAFFDLDKTVISTSSALAFTRPFFRNGLLDAHTLATSVYTQLTFALSSADADHVERLRQHVTTMCRGWDVAEVHRIVADAVDDRISPLVYSGAADLIAAHRAQGHAVILVSASGRDIVAPIGVLLGVDHVRATEMAVANGRYTGELDFYCYGEDKAVAIRAIAAEHGYDLQRSFAYSDSITDVPMLEAVGHPSVVNPDRQLRRHADAAGWPTLDFRSASARSTPRTPALIAALVVAVGAVVGCGLRLVRRSAHPLDHSPADHLSTTKSAAPQRV